jgi:uncharacterized protein with HEPN domain
MRNLLTYTYLDADHDVFWEVVVRDIPVLHDQMAKIVHDTSGDDITT